MPLVSQKTLGVITTTLPDEVNGGSASPDAFGYDPQNRLTNAYNPAGRLTNYEGVGNMLDSNFPVHAIKNPGYTYDANGNLTTRNGQTLVWDVENRLSAVSGTGVSETYLYDPDGQRVKKTSDGVESYYVNPFYEVEVNGITTTETK